MDKVLNTHLQNFMSCSGNLLIGNRWLKLRWLMTLILFCTPMGYKQWNLHIYIQKQLSRLSGNTLCNSRKKYFFCRCFQCLIFHFKEPLKHSTNEQVVEIRYIALVSYKSFNGPRWSRTDFEKSFKYLYKLGLKILLTKFEHSLTSRNFFSHCLYLYLSASLSPCLPISLTIH